MMMMIMIFYYPLIRRSICGNVVGRICLYLSVCLSVFNSLTFESLDLESSFFCRRVQLPNI